MNNDAKVSFRCIGNPRVIYTPQYLHDVEAMRKHMDYEELDAAGNPVVKVEGPQVLTIPIRTAPLPAPKAPAKRKK